MLLSKASKDNYKLPMACLKIKITQRYSGKILELPEPHNL